MIAEGEISAIEIFEDETEEMIASLDLKSLLQKRVPEKGQCPCPSTISTLPVKREASYTVFFLVGYPQPLPCRPSCCRVRGTMHDAQSTPRALRLRQPL
jgi:hypothetical protein